MTQPVNPEKDALVYLIASAIDRSVDAALDAGDAGWEREAQAVLDALRDAGYAVLPPAKRGDA